MKEKELKPCLDTPPETVACVLPSTGDTARGAAREMRGGKKGPGWTAYLQRYATVPALGMPLPCFCGGLGRYFSFFFSMHTRRHFAVRGKFGCWSFVGCLVSYLNDAMASASFDRLCANMIPVIYLMIERSDWEGEGNVKSKRLENQG